MIIGGDTIEGVVEPAQRVWNTWGLHILVLLSFALQIMLLIMAEVRRRKKSWAVRAVVWSAYVLADTVAVYTLGHFTVSSRSPEHVLMALWAPLLLVHLGGQDNITAYALEDNRLWLRHLQNFGVQVAAAVYVLYQSSILRRPSRLRAATILMFVVGVVKYGERVWALFGSSDSSGGEILKIDITEKEVDKAYHELEMKISWAYHEFYSKRVLSPCGICIRVISLLATIAAFLLLHVFITDKDGLTSVDVSATYILLVGALVLEITSVLRLVLSLWVFMPSRDQPPSLGYLIWSSMQRAGVRTMYWSGSMGQLDLLDMCSNLTRDSQRTKTKIGRWWMRRCSSLNLSTSIPVGREVIKMVMETVDDRGCFFFQDEEIRPALEEEIEMLINRLQSQVEEQHQVLKKSEIVRDVAMIVTRLVYQLKLPILGTVFEGEIDRVVSGCGLHASYSDRRNIATVVGGLMDMVKRLGEDSRIHFLRLRRMGFQEDIEGLLRGEKLELEESILVWHIATHVYLQQHQAEEIDHLAKATKVLSDYAVYLLAAHRPLKPNFSGTCTIKDVVQAAQHKSEGEVLMRLIRDQGGKEWVNLHVAVDRTFKNGFQVGSNLISKGTQGRATLLPIFQLWLHILSTLEEKLGPDFHARQLSNGGEFLTFLSVLLKRREKAQRREKAEEDRLGEVQLVEIGVGALPSN